MNRSQLLYTIPFLICGFLLFQSCQSNNQKEAGNQINTILKKFDFGSGKTENGFVRVTGEMIYGKKRGYGFVSDSVVNGVDRKTDDALHSDFCTSNAPFYFFVDLPEGNYRVKVHFGDAKGTSLTTLKAESRRLMLHNIQTSEGEFKTETFTISRRSPRINEADSIRRKERELAFLNWDNRLSLEFNNTRPCINGIEVAKVSDVTTVFLAGNSTVVDQEYVPWAAWGQMLPLFFDDKVVIANYAESGEAMLSFIRENRLKKILSQIKPGDYLFIQFGHNDQKKQSSAYLEAHTGYKKYLSMFVDTTRAYGATPVLISSMHRRKFDENGNLVNTHGYYPQAVRDVAKEKDVALVDLNKMSGEFYKALGVEGSRNAFVQYPAHTFPGQDKALADNSHHSTYGAYELAQCVVKGIREDNLNLVRHLRPGIKPFDPSHPLLFKDFDVPFSPAIQLLRPEGN